MTIEYKDSKRIVALSSDVIETPTGSNNFSTTTGEANTGSAISIHGGVLGGDYKPTGSAEASTVDPLGTTLSDTAWIARFKATVNTLTNPSSETCLANIGFFSGDGSSISSEDVIMKLSS